MIWALLCLFDTGMTFWMMVDAARKRADWAWFMLIMMPMGQWVYFIAVKSEEFEFRFLKKLFEKPVTLQELALRAEETPSHENKIKLAHALRDAGRIADAEYMYFEVLKLDGKDLEALYGAAMCLSRQQLWNESAKCLQEIIEIDRGYEDFQPWLALASCYNQLGRYQDEVWLMDELVKVSPCIKHKAIYGKVLYQNGNHRDANRILREAIREYDYSAKFIKKANREWQRQARSTLAEIS